MPPKYSHLLDFMKFSKTLKETQVQEWRKKYIAYEHLKSLVDQNEESFFSALEGEVEKVEEFYKMLKQGAVRGLILLLNIFPEEDYPTFHEQAHTLYAEVMARTGASRQKKALLERKKLNRTHKAAESRILEFYMALTKIARYKEMNLTGFRKILKKYDKKNDTSHSMEKMQSISERSTFFNDQIPEILELIKRLHRKITPERNRAKAKKLVVDLTEADSGGDGKSYIAGAMATTGLFYMYFSLDKKFLFCNGALIGTDVMLLFFGVLLYVCRKSFINYNLILEMNLKPKMKISKYFLLIGGLILFHGLYAYLDIYWWGVYGISLFTLLMPINILDKGVRYYFVKTLTGLCTCTVYGKVRFKHFFIADHLLSLRPFLIWSLKRAYSSPSFLAMSFINVVPVAIRISQCLRRHFEQKKMQRTLHIYNIAKYMLILVGDISIVFQKRINNNICICLILASNIFGFIWDVYVDWMLWKRPMVFQRKTYILLCALNIGVRAFSVLFFAFRSIFTDFPQNYILSTGLFLCILEMFRRLAWGVIRMEVEHLNNCDRLKAINGPLNDLFYMENVEQK